MSLADLRAACLPFTTRAFRGPRLRRMLVLSAALGLLSVLVGLWLALGSGSFEREVRTGLGFERSSWERERAEFVVIARTDFDFEMLSRDAERWRAGRSDGGLIQHRVAQAVRVVNAAHAIAAPPAHAELAEQVEALWSRIDEDPRLYDFASGLESFTWSNPHDVGLLRAIVERDLVPSVERYRSPLGGGDAMQMIGLVAGGVLGVLMLLVAPVLAGVQLAQEVHENTLVPLTGTALGSRQLVLGLAAAPLAQAGLLALPQLGILIAMGLAAARPIPLVGFVVLLAAAGLLATMLGQLFGLTVGRRRTPGLVGVSLVLVLGMLGAIGLGVGGELERDTAGLVTVVPAAGPVHLLRETFAPASHLSAAVALATDLRLGFAAAAFFGLAAVLVLALERRVAATVGTTLTRREAFAAALLLSWMTALALPTHVDAMVVMFASLALVVVPFMLLLMARVEVGDLAPTLRVVRLRPLLAEFGGFVLVHLVVVVLVADHADALVNVGPAGLAHLSWALLVAALLAVRAAATPANLAGMVWSVVCALLAVVAFVSAVVWSNDARPSLPFFALSGVSPVLGLVQAAATLWVPWSLVRAIRRATIGTRLAASDELGGARAA